MSESAVHTAPGPASSGSGREKQVRRAWLGRHLAVRPQHSHSPLVSLRFLLWDASVSRFAGDKELHLITVLCDYNKLYRSCRSHCVAHFLCSECSSPSQKQVFSPSLPWHTCLSAFSDYRLRVRAALPEDAGSSLAASGLWPIDSRPRCSARFPHCWLPKNVC